mmetsp:Transcript_2953/g.6929  ORF Transcript_2953/g.6929 Transcript_2953/m.6929 type:complete len:209 (-) Transcript_2953:966-1592(-)
MSAVVVSTSASEAFLLELCVEALAPIDKVRSRVVHADLRRDEAERRVQESRVRARADHDDVAQRSHQQVDPDSDVLCTVLGRVGFSPRRACAVQRNHAGVDGDRGRCVDAAWEEPRGFRFGVVVVCEDKVGCVLELQMLLGFARAANQFLDHRRVEDFPYPRDERVLNADSRLVFLAEVLVASPDVHPDDRELHPVVGLFPRVKLMQS